MRHRPVSNQAVSSRFAAPARQVESAAREERRQLWRKAVIEARVQRTHAIARQVVHPTDRLGKSTQSV